MQTVFNKFVETLEYNTRIIRNIFTLQVFIMDDENVLYIRTNGIHSAY